MFNLNYQRMKKTILTLSVFIMSFGFLVAQTSQVSVSWSDEMKKSRYHDFANVLGEDSEGLFIVNENTLSEISAGENTAIIEKYDYKMNQIFSKELIVRFHDNEAAYYRSMKLGGKFYLFTTFWDKKEKIKYFLANTITDKGELTGEPKVIFEMAEQGRGAPWIGFSRSFDSTKVLLYTDLKEKKDEEESYYFKALDKDLNMIWENKVSLPYTSKNFEIDMFSIDNNANINIVGKVKKERGEREKGTPVYFYTLVSYFYTTKEIKEFKPDLGDSYVSSISITPDMEGNLIATGFFSENSENSVRGVFYMKISPSTKTILTQKSKAFDPEFLSLFFSEKKAEKGGELYNFKIDHLSVDQDGNTTVAAEQYYVQVYTSTNSSGSTSTRYVYNYNHIIVIKFSKEGEVLWWNKIPKLQRGGNATYFSYLYAIKNNTVYVMYNEHKKNIENLDPKKMAYLGNPKDAITVLVSLDKDGKLSKLPMFESKEDDGTTIFQPTTARYLSKSEYLVLSIRGKTYKLGKINF